MHLLSDKHLSLHRIFAERRKGHEEDTSKEHRMHDHPMHETIVNRGIVYVLKT